MTVTAITLTITMTALNTAAIEYTMGNTFAVGLAGEKIMHGVDDNDEVVTVAVVMVVIRPVKFTYELSVAVGAGINVS